MRGGGVIVAAVSGAVAGFLVLPLLDRWHLSPTWARVASVAVAGVYAGVFTVMGETFIEDIVKLVMIGVTAAVLWYLTTGVGLIAAGVLFGAVVGSVTNSIIPQRSADRPQPSSKTED